jgi:C4-dicarboxylate transporter DctQ subunit
MKNLIDKIFRIMDIISKLLCGICAIGFFSVITYQIICRYFFNISVNWSDEVGRYLFVLMVFMGCILAVGEKGHFSIDLVTTFFSKKLSYVVNIIVHILSMVFLTILAFSGMELAKRTATQTSNVLSIPMPLLYSIIYFSAIIMIIYTIRVMIEDIISARKQMDTENGGTK